MRLRAAAGATSLLLKGPMSHVTVNTDTIWDIGLPDKPASTPVIDAWAKSLGDCDPGSRVGKQPIALSLKQRTGSLIL